jgi:Domain of unknown function (DUF4389)
MQIKAPDDQTSASDVWMRGLFMLLLMIGFAIGQWLLNLLAIVQFLWLLFVREPSLALASFGNSLSIWLAEVGRFLTCASEEKPFPWRPWPDTATSSRTE